MKHGTATLRVLGRAPREAGKAPMASALPVERPVGASRTAACGDLLLASSDAAWVRHLQPILQERGMRRVKGVEDRVALEKALTEFTPDVLLLDPSAGAFSLESVWIIRTLSPTTRTIFLTTRPDDAEALAALREGAAGYGPRHTDEGLLLAAIGMVRQGGIWVAPQIVLRLVDEFASRRRSSGNAPRLPGLTAREGQVAELTASGATNKEIAGRLRIEERTVKAHLSNTFHKLGVSNRLQLASYFWTRPKVQ
jgi:two-component system, NarL family, nitrate/nitrite response regulator NarL